MSEPAAESARCEAVTAMAGGRAAGGAARRTDSSKGGRGEVGGSVCTGLHVARHVARQRDRRGGPYSLEVYSVPLSEPLSVLASVDDLVEAGQSAHAPEERATASGLGPPSRTPRTPHRRFRRARAQTSAATGELVM